MNILHLKYAIEIAKTGSLNKAAENLYMGQPNLSRAIKELEAGLGISIFERSAKGMVPTPEGKDFLMYAEQILAKIEEVEAIYRSGAQKKQRFSITVPHASYISEAFTAFTNQLDTSVPAELFYSEGSSSQAVQNILTSDYKLGIVRYSECYDRQFKEMLDEKGLAGELVAEFVPRLIMSRENPLAEADEITFGDLERCIELAQTDLYVPFTTAKLPEPLTDCPRRLFVYDRASRLELLSLNHETYMWGSPLPKEQLERCGLVERSCRESRQIWRDTLIRRRDYQLTKLDGLFITELTASRRRNLG